LLIVWELVSQNLAHQVEPSFGIFVALGPKFIVNVVDQFWNQAIGVSLATNDGSFLDLEENINNAPIEPCFNVVGELRGLSIEPIPVSDLIVELLDMWGYRERVVDGFERRLTPVVLVLETLKHGL
jgi:hypothetical protein